MQIPADLEKVMARVKEKRQAFQEYNFSIRENDALKTFFDLAQEYETLENFYRIAVSVLKEFFGLEARLYLLGPEENLQLVCDTVYGLYTDKPLAAPPIHLEGKPYVLEQSWVAPIRGNLLLVDRLPFFAKDQTIGLLEVFPIEKLSERDRFFLEKYANRLGYNLHVKIISWQNIQHIRFINSLVADIEHNVILPNISLSLYLRHLRQRIQTLKELDCLCEVTIKDCQKFPESQKTFRQIVDGMETAYQALDQHYKGVSLFIESLFRPSHFQKGHLVLRRRPTRVQSEVIMPQLQLHLPKFRERHIDIDEAHGGVPDQEMMLSVDKGLMAQVYANLFSNAAKYTRSNNEGRKYVSYGVELIPGFFGANKDGLKFNVFTTGPHISAEDAPRIFEEGYRGRNTDGEVGTGRGLYFVRNVIETHGGAVGYEPTNGGNNFYFVLPVPAATEPTLSVELGSAN